MKADLAKQVVQTLTARNLTFCSAESCTGGGIGASITAISGASAVYRGGIISYCNEVKHKLLHVSQSDLDTLGAVSEPVARQMAEGARLALEADLAVSVTGLAGPNSDGSGKPVGLVYVGAASKNGSVVREFHFAGDRDQVRVQAIDAALTLLLHLAEGQKTPR